MLLHSEMRKQLQIGLLKNIWDEKAMNKNFTCTISVVGSFAISRLSGSFGACALLTFEFGEQSITGGGPARFGGSSKYGIDILT